MRGTFNILAIESPGFGDRKKQMLEDIAILTGASIISEEAGRKLEDVKIEDLGRADRIVSDKDKTIVVGGKGIKKQIEKRIAQIKAEIEKTTSEFDQEKLQERLAKLSGGVAVIQVGGATEVEMKETQERVKDALGATKAALEEGIVSGGGVALLIAAKAIEVKTTVKGDEKTGMEMVKKALQRPTRLLAENAGVDGGIVIENISRKPKGTGFDVMDEVYKDMIKAGIIDPAKVTITALQNAVSVAMMILTTEGLVTDIESPEEKSHTPPMGVPGM